MSLTTEIGAHVYLYFSNTRCGTKEMWAHWLEEVVFKSIKKSMDKDDNPDTSQVNLDYSDINLI